MKEGGWWIESEGSHSEWHIIQPRENFMNYSYSTPNHLERERGEDGKYRQTKRRQKGRKGINTEKAVKVRYEISRICIGNKEKAEKVGSRQYKVHGRKQRRRQKQPASRHISSHHILASYLVSSYLDARFQNLARIQNLEQRLF